ncbi:MULTISPECIES: entericidin A/B family lipoprotein [unclassified Methylophaga]|jgi:predicted small secreted protein|nr:MULTISPECIES: entericidin A/B family lipoprotein [unclassified Methylophaga]MAL49786.1 Entericidin EcnAB [Methylophaga sp.]MAP27395.1 Entericidin EcnAB [Methylophaga sp.]MBP26393.1 Entericidin EcnAB [Methylophaga sp.]HAD30371.1 Entericidin EcnAB [Methylophaga sp.]HCC82557.1 Entericidin EcnAB [Methylophaga sp.]|tara:strand:+ start:2131 stop:2271 length:141 start_codon:yes stop_codon:yes gene_type:complete
MKITAVFLSLFFIFGLAACNTIGGIGEDVEAAGGAVEESAEENKNY